MDSSNVIHQCGTKIRTFSLCICFERHSFSPRASHFSFGREIAKRCKSAATCFHALFFKQGHNEEHKPSISKNIFGSNMRKLQTPEHKKKETHPPTSARSFDSFALPSTNDDFFWVQNTYKTTTILFPQVQKKSRKDGWDSVIVRRHGPTGPSPRVVGGQNMEWVVKGYWCFPSMVVDWLQATEE